MSAWSPDNDPVIALADEVADVLVKHRALEKAQAWAEGFLTAWYVERGWSPAEAVEKAKNPSPDDVDDLIPEGSNPYED